MKLNHLSKITPRRAVSIIQGNRDDVMREMVRKSLGFESDFVPNVASEWQRTNIESALIDFEFDTGISLLSPDWLNFDDDLSAKPDAWCSDGFGVTVKCPYNLRKSVAPVDFGDMPAKHYDYMQFSMYVAGCSKWHYYLWTPGGSQYKVIKADIKWQQLNIPSLKQFYAEYLHELEHNADEHRAPLRKVIDTPEAHRAIEEWDDLCEKISLLEERKKDLQADLIELAGDKNALIAGRKFTKVEKQGAISYAKAIKSLLPDADLEKWRGNPSTSWKLT